MMYDAGTCAVKKAREEVGCGGNEDVNRMSEVTKLGRIMKEIEGQRRWEIVQESRLKWYGYKFLHLEEKKNMWARE